MADLNQSLISQFQPQNGLPPELLIALEELLGRGEGGRGISTTGFRQPNGVTAAPPSLDLSDRLTGAFTDTPTFDASTLDRLQKAGSLLGVLGPAGSAINFALGQLARAQANKAFPTQDPIGFFEDIFAPDIFAGSPLEILQGRATAGTGAERGATRTIGGSRVSAGPVSRGGRASGGGFGRGRDPGGGAAGSPF